MAITVEVNAVDRSSLIDMEGGGIRWNVPINARGTGAINFKDLPAGFVPVDGQSVEVKDGVTVIFGGILINPKKKPSATGGPIKYGASLSDYTFLTDKRHVWKKYTDTALETIVADINTNFLDGEGLTVTGVATGPAITVTFNGVTATQALNELCVLAGDGRSWYIDTSKDIVMTTLSATATPGTVTDATFLQKQPVDSWTERGTYVNRVVVLAGTNDLPIMVEASDSAEIAARAAAETGSGIYERVQQINEIKTADEASDAADRLLTQQGGIRKLVTGFTRTLGFRGGQQGTVNLPELGLTSETMFVETVDAEINQEHPKEVWYKIRMSTEDPFGGWQTSWRNLRSSLPPTIPLTFEPSPGLVRILPEPGVLIHDPPQGPDIWARAEASGSFPKTPSALGMDNSELEGAGSGQFVWALRRGGGANTDGCSGGTFPGYLIGAASCFANRQSILEAYRIDENNKVGNTVYTGFSWDELGLGGYKKSCVISPDDRYLAFIRLDSTTLKFGVVDISGAGFQGSVTSTMNNNAAPGEPVWVGNYVYWPNVNDGKIFIYNVTSPTAPVETGSFTTTLTAVESLVASSDGEHLYACGSGSRVLALDISTPGTIIEDDAEILTQAIYLSVDINEDDDMLIMFAKADASNVRYCTVDINAAGDTLTKNTEDTIALATTDMEGRAVVMKNGAAICFSEQEPGLANELESYVFNVTDPTNVTLTEKLTYTHAASGNLGPFRSTLGRKVLYAFGFNTDFQITHGEDGYDEIVPYEIERPLREDFGGTGETTYVLGDLLVGDAGAGLDQLGAGSDGETLVADSSETLGLKWAAAGDATIAAIMSRLSLRF